MVKDIKTILREQEEAATEAANAEHAWADKLLKQAATGVMTANTPEEKAIEKLITLPGGWLRNKQIYVTKNSFPKAEADAIWESIPPSIKKQLHLVPMKYNAAGDRVFTMNVQRMSELAESLGFVKAMFQATKDGQTR